MRKKAISKESIKRQKMDRMRPLRVGKYLDFPFVLPDSPVEIEKGFIVSDRDTYDVFASFIFKCLSNTPIHKLTIRLFLYLNQNIPYKKIDFTYSQEDLTFGMIQINGEDLKLSEANKRTCINKNECFGSCVFIPIPESYFTKIEVMLVSVEYFGGEVEVLETLVSGDNQRYSELDEMSKMAYHRDNIYLAAEKEFPTTVIPQFGNRVWLCCCGNKNAIDSKVCEKCGRDMEWQKSTTIDAIQEKKEALSNEPSEIRFHDKSKFSQNKYLENDADVQKKIVMYEKAMEKIALEEKRKEKNRMMAVPKALLWFGVIYLLVSLIQYFLYGGGFWGVIVTLFEIIINDIKIILST